MDLISLMTENREYLYFALAGVLILIDLLVIGAGVVFFIGLSSIFVATLISFSIVDDFFLEVAMLGVFSVFLTKILYSPLKKWQNNVQPDSSSDMIGMEFVALSDITNVSGRISYSGIQWETRTKEEIIIKKGTLVTIKEIKGTLIFVE
jgi:membrane protein implicated in regulation of membrane protease activity